MSEPIRPLVLSEREIASVAPSLGEIADIVADTFRLDGEGGVEVPSKIGVHPDHRNSFCHAMPAWVPARRALGMKWVSYFPGIATQGLPESTGIIVLNDPDRGLPVAIMEGMWITYARTTACAAVMARALAVSQPRTLALIGCGGLGRWMVRMAEAALPSVETVLVYSRTRESRLRFCERLQGQTQMELQPVASAREAVGAADLIVSSIPPPEAPFIEAQWLRPDALAVPLDYFHCYRADAVAAMETIYVDDTQKIAAMTKRLLDGDRAPPVVDFGPFAAGRQRVARAPGRCAMAMPTGVASTDMTVAWEIYRRAAQAGLGIPLALTGP